MSSRFQVGDIVRKVHGLPWLGKVLKVEGDRLSVEFSWEGNTFMGYVSENSVEMFQECGGRRTSDVDE